MIHLHDTMANYTCWFLSHILLLATPWTIQSVRLLCPWNSQGKNTGVGCYLFLQGIFLTQGSNQGLPHCRQSHQRRVLINRGPLGKGMAKHFNILALRTPWTVWKGKKMWHWKINAPGQYMPNMLLEKSGEIAPEGRKRLSQSGNNTLLWMWLVIEAVWCCKEQYCIGTWNVRSMNQGKLKVVKQEMARLTF